MENDFAQLDFDRRERRGALETIFCQGKSNSQLLEIVRRFHASGEDAFGTRASAEQAEVLKAEFPEIQYDALSRTILLPGRTERPRSVFGPVAVCCAGTADTPVAEEAAKTAEFLGCHVERFYDIGIAALHRVVSALPKLREAKAVICCAGMEGALPSVVAGLIGAPVIAVPTSVGYGASFQGLTALLSMLNSCAEGVAVVNIDNGFGAGYMAFQIVRPR